MLRDSSRISSVAARVGERDVVDVVHSMLARYLESNAVIPEVSDAELEVA